jgi:hypothetical protein
MTSANYAIAARAAKGAYDGLFAAFRAGRFVVTATCERCAASQEWTTPRAFESDAVVAKARRAGWKTGKHVVCAECQKIRKEPKMTETPKPAAAATPAPPPEPAKAEPSDAAKRARRLIYMGLEDYYDDTAKRYRAGHSDASIAEEVGVAVSVVAAIRETDFGPLGVPEEIADLQRAIFQTQDFINDEVRKLGAEMRRVEERLSRAITDAKERQEGLASKLEALRQRNGWK